MTKKKNKLFALICSLIPGAGEMYLGFFKCGVSLMAAFFILLGLSGFLGIGFLAYLTPLIWFYSFFHTNNLNSLSDEEFYTVEDRWLIGFSDLPWEKLPVTRCTSLIAAALILFGVCILWSSFAEFFVYYLLPALSVSEETWQLFCFLTEMVPQTAVAILIIAAGVRLIRSRYRDLNDGPSIVSPSDGGPSSAAPSDGGLSSAAPSDGGSSSAAPSDGGPSSAAPSAVPAPGRQPFSESAPAPNPPKSGRSEDAPDQRAESSSSSSSLTEPARQSAPQASNSSCEP